MKKILSIALCAAMLLGCLVVASAAEKKDEPSYKAENSIFESMPEHFVFSSGAGGWATNLYIENDGSFTGEYLDTEIGDKGNSYPNGTVYICNFEGKFSEPTQKDEYTYSTRIESLELEKTPDDVYYENGIRYICTEPYGLGNADEFLIYLPGIRMDNLPDTFALWLPAGDRTKETLPYYGIYNVGGGYGFFESDGDYVSDSDTDTSTDEPITIEYTAAELVNKTVPEIVDIMGGNFQFGTVYLGDDQSGSFVIDNPSTLYGFEFILDGINSTDFQKDFTNEVANVKAGKYSLRGIIIAGSAKLDNNISADMRYSDLTKYYGNFSCVVSGGAGNVCYSLTDSNGKLMATFTFKSDGLDFSQSNGTVTADMLKTVNPQIKDIVVFPGYVPTTLDSDTDSDDSDVKIIGFDIDYGIGCGESVDMYVYLRYGADTEPISNPNLVFKSSNELVATIKDENGKVTVTGVSGGTATLTATETVTKATATCDVTVFNGSDFTLGEDNLWFINSAENFYNSGEIKKLKKLREYEQKGSWNWFDIIAEGPLPTEYDDIKYQLSDEVYQRLLDHAINDVERQLVIDHYNSVWSGSCFGMSSVMSIMYSNPSALPISNLFVDFNDDTKVHDLPAPVKSSEMEDLVNYYHLTQDFNFYKNIGYNQAYGVKEDYAAALNKLIDSINNTTIPVSVGIQVANKCNKKVNGIESEQVEYTNGHIILLLRIKNETKDYYTIECYDPNRTEDFTELVLYKTVGEITDEGFNIEYNVGHSYNLISVYLDNTNYMDQLNFFSTETADSEALIADTLTMYYNPNNFSITANGKTLVEGSQSKNDSVLGPVPTGAGEVADSEIESVSELTYFVDKGYADEYTVLCEDGDHYGKAEITLENHMFSITAKDSGEATFNDKTGAMNVSMNEKSDYIVRVTDNENICNWDWFTLTVRAEDSKELDVQFTNDGVLINGDNLKGTEITVNNASDDSTLTIDENMTNVMITKSGSEITAKEMKQEGSTNTTKSTSNVTNGSQSAVPTGAVTGGIFAIVVLAVSGIVTLITGKRKKI